MPNKKYFIRLLALIVPAYGAIHFLVFKVYGESFSSTSLSTTETLVYTILGIACLTGAIFLDRFLKKKGL